MRLSEMKMIHMSLHHNDFTAAHNEKNIAGQRHLDKQNQLWRGFLEHRNGPL